MSSTLSHSNFSHPWWLQPTHRDVTGPHSGSTQSPSPGLGLEAVMLQVIKFFGMQDPTKGHSFQVVPITVSLPCVSPSGWPGCGGGGHGTDPR